MIRGSSHYETWVLTLRAWSQDPQVDISDLPVLDEHSVPAGVFTRLADHIVAAQNVLMRSWRDRFERLLGAAQTEFDVAQAMLDGRRVLRRRVELARHPSLPQSLREALEEACTRDLQRIQEELEQSIRDAASAQARDASFWERRLLAVHQNPVTGALTAPLVPPIASEEPAPVANRRWPRRRVL